MSLLFKTATLILDKRSKSYLVLTKKMPNNFDAYHKEKLLAKES